MGLTLMSGNALLESTHKPKWIAAMIIANNNGL
jgi:hypothetical protein